MEKYLPANFRSDKRIKGGIIGQCRICLNNKELRLSHIIPRWVYKGLKDETRKKTIIGVYKSLNAQILIQDGTKKYLLCHECEQLLGEAENYVKILMIGSEQERTKKNIIWKNGTILSYDPKRIYRFLFSIILKIHYCDAAPFHDSNFEQKMVENMRYNIIHPNDDYKNIFVVAQQFYSKAVPSINPQAIVNHSFKDHKNDHKYFSVLLGGWEWIICFKNENIDLIDIVMSNYMSSLWPLKVLKGDIIEHRFVQYMISNHEP